MLSPLLQQLVESLAKLPGIGPKSAQRIAFHLLKEKSRNTSDNLAKALLDSKNIRHCKTCRIYTEDEQCKICCNTQRNCQQVCVVEGPADVMAIEQSAGYRGKYFVLLGHLSPIDGIGPSDLGLPDWLDNLEKQGVKEVIVATNLTVEGEVTAQYIAQALPESINCSRIAHGVPSGGELEYLDGNTLAHALNSRVQVQMNITEEV